MSSIIRIKRSGSSGAPSPGLAAGELAYSFVSNTLFIGDQYGDIITIGGDYYTNIIDNATTDDIPNTLVLRDDNGTINVVVDLVDGGLF